MTQPLKKIVLTGARGALGTELRPALARLAETLVSTDIAGPPDKLLRNETYVAADLARMDEIAPLMAGAEMVVHFGAVVDEKPFEELLGPNYVGAYNVWEAAWRAGARRVDLRLVDPRRRDVRDHRRHRHRRSRTGPTPSMASPSALPRIWAGCTGKSAGWRASALRILSCTREPQNLRALGTWLSYRDMVHLVERAILTAVTGFSVVYGVSANSRAPVLNHKAAFLGYRPQDNAEDWAEPVRGPGRRSAGYGPDPGRRPLRQGPAGRERGRRDPEDGRAGLMAKRRPSPACVGAAAVRAPRPPSAIAAAQRHVA